MIERTVAGPMTVQPIPGGDPGDRALICQETGEIRSVYRMGKELAEMLGKMLLMPDQELIDLHEREAKAEEARGKLLRPGDVDPAAIRQP